MKLFQGETDVDVRSLPEICSLARLTMQNLLVEINRVNVDHWLAVVLQPFALAWFLLVRPNLLCFERRLVCL